MKIVFITGGSTGIGVATVRKFISEGWNVGFTDINTTATEELKRDINLPSRLLFTEGNTRHRDEIHRAVRATVERFGALNEVCAGTIRTPLVDNLFRDFAKVNHCSVDDYWQAENKLYARGKAGQPEEVAEMIYFLSSGASSFCTGGHYLVDGGLVAR